MKARVLLFAAIVAAMPTMALSDGMGGGTIGMYSDFPGFSDLCLREQVGVVNNVYVVHTLATSGRSARFRVDIGDWGVVLQPTDYHGNTVVGDVYTGVEIAYPDYLPGISCQPLPYLVAELHVLVTAISPYCTMAYVRPHPDVESGKIETIDCSGNTLEAAGGALIVNPDSWGTCPCVWDPLETEAGTWGSIKALYR